MGPTHLGVIVDSSVAIDAEREQLNVAQFLKRMANQIGEREASLCVITVAELAHGIHRANTPERRTRRRAFLDELKAALPIHAITETTAELAGRIGAECAAKSIIIPFDDLLIGASALEHGCAVVTRNVRHFEKIPGLTVIAF
jgi:tRNA(fMet)-specific endonuclease VapC